MKLKKNRRYSSEEDSIILSELSKNRALKTSLNVVGRKLGRKPQSIRDRYRKLESPAKKVSSPIMLDNKGNIHGKITVPIKNITLVNNLLNIEF